MRTGRLPGLAIAYGPWALAAVLWIASAATCAGDLQVDSHGLLDAGTTVASFWVIARHYGGPRLGPGEMVVSQDDYRRGERLVIDSIAAAHGEGCIMARPPSGRALRSI